MTLYGAVGASSRTKSRVPVRPTSAATVKESPFGGVRMRRPTVSTIGNALSFSFARHPSSFGIAVVTHWKPCRSIGMSHCHSSIGCKPTLPASSGASRPAAMPMWSTRLTPNAKRSKAVSKWRVSSVGGTVPPSAAYLLSSIPWVRFDELSNQYCALKRAMSGSPRRS